jgi:hypothetical protein
LSNGTGNVPPGIKLRSRDRGAGERGEFEASFPSSGRIRFDVTRTGYGEMANPGDSNLVSHPLFFSELEMPFPFVMPVVRTPVKYRAQSPGGPFLPGHAGPPRAGFGTEANRCR